MQSEIDQKKPVPDRASKKSDGWREREESRNASVAPRTMTPSDEPSHVRC